MKIRAKVRCDNVDENGSVTFSAVTTGSEENKSFSEATPSLQLTMYVSNPAAKGAFEQGKEYYLDFTPAG